MRRPMSALVAATAAVMSAVLIAACEAQVHGDPGRSHNPRPASLPATTVLPLLDAPLSVTKAALDGLDIRVSPATAEAAENGAQLSVLVLDRVTDQTVSNGNNTPIATASVAKPFIADDLLLQDLKGQIQLSPHDRKALDTMLRSSDDNAGEEFWDRGEAIVTRVAARYGLGGTASPPDGRRWNTISTLADLVRYYDMLL